MIGTPIPGLNGRLRDFAKAVPKSHATFSWTPLETANKVGGLSESLPSSRVDGETGSALVANMWTLVLTGSSLPPDAKVAAVWRAAIPRLFLGAVAGPADLSCLTPYRGWRDRRALAAVPFSRPEPSLQSIERIYVQRPSMIQVCFQAVRKKGPTRAPDLARPKRWRDRANQVSTRQAEHWTAHIEDCQRQLVPRIFGRGPGREPWRSLWLRPTVLRDVTQQICVNAR